MEFDEIHNHHESAVFAAVREKAASYPELRGAQLLGDVACVALNRLPARYIRHEVDLAFYMTNAERERNAKLVDEAVLAAFKFIQDRHAATATAA